MKQLLSKISEKRLFKNLWKSFITVLQTNSQLIRNRNLITRVQYLGLNYFSEYICNFLMMRGLALVEAVAALL